MPYCDIIIKLVKTALWLFYLLLNGVDLLMFYNLTTVGCQMNEHDSEIIAGILETEGFSRTDDFDKTDLFIFNTCAVRESAENRVLGRLGALKAYKEKNPSVVIAVCGCMIQQGDAAARIFKRAPFVDIIFSSHNASQLPSMLAQVRSGMTPVLEVTEPEQVAEEAFVQRLGSVKAYVTIMYGCDNFCSYCIVPYVRGRERSREPHAILDEIKQIAKDGYKEVMLLGQNVNSYGKSFNGNYDFSDLLQQIVKIPGIERIRFMTSHPRDFSEKLIYTIANNDKICKQIHLPIQSGSDSILKAMNRGYTQSEYLALVSKIRQALPNAALTTDIIVGFPGEKDEDFEETLKVVRQVKFDAAFTFVYSKRTGTSASLLLDQVPLNDRKNRMKSLLQLQNEIGFEINQKLVGQVLPIIVEGSSKTKEDILIGRTDTGKGILFSGNTELVGKTITVKILSAQTWNIFGEIIKGGEI